MSAPSEEQLRRLGEESEGGPARTLGPWLQWIALGLAATLSLYALYWTQFSINTTVYRASFLAFILTLALMLYPARRGADNRVSILDWLLIAVGVAALAYLATHTDAVKTRAMRPLAIEIALGGALILIVLEATRRTTGWALPLIAAGFLAYAYLGPYVPAPLDHRGYSIHRIVGQNYLTLEGLFSTPVDVAATFIILFTIYGAVLEKGGAGGFFIDWAFALFGKRPRPSAPGRAVVASGFLLGTVSGSGVATTVTLASLSWPMLRRSGYTANVAGGMLASAGIGATLSPPTLGAAAFIIAEYLKISYLDVLVMAIVPTLLYYLSCWLMMEADVRRLKIEAIRTSEHSLWELTRRGGYHFLSLGAIAVLLAMGFSAFMAVFWSIAVAFALSLIRHDTSLATRPAAALGAVVMVLAIALGTRVSVGCFYGLMAATLVSAGQWLAARVRGAEPDPASARLIAALIEGGRSVVGIAATCATAGIIVSIVTLTGLGLKVSGLVVDLGGGTLLFTIVFAALAMWLLGTAVPVTASYIIAAVMLVPALREVGVPEPAAHMFMFYYAVLADVSPPTALAPFAAATITGGRPFATMFQAWKYCLPAFVVPFIFCLGPNGLGLLLFGEWPRIFLTSLFAGLAMAGLAIAFAGWIRGPANALERVIAGVGGALMLATDFGVDLIGLALVAAAVGLHLARAAFAQRPRPAGD